MKDRKVFEALRIQMENASANRDIQMDKCYTGLKIATLAIIQAKKLNLSEALQVVNFVNFHISDKELAKWTT